MKKLAAILIAIVSLSVVGAAAFVTAQLDLTPLQQNIDVGTVGHYTLTLTTNEDAKGGDLSWQTDDAGLLAGINGAPTGQFGSYPITTSSSCSGTPLTCTQTFDLQVSPQSGITANTLHSVSVFAFNQKGVAKAMVTGGTIPTPEVATGVLMSAGLLGLVGLTRYRRK